MRFRFVPQVKLGTTPIGDIDFDLYSRHELVPILMALQHLYVHCPAQLEKILALIQKDTGKETVSSRGCIGMSHWEILVLAAVRLGCNMDFDLLADLASYHQKLRQMLLLSDWEKKRYARATVHDNYSQLSPETVGAISDIVVGIGHQLSSDPLEKVRADTFVLQKNVHHPTDTNLLYDGCRRIIALSKKIADQFTIAGWRKNGHWKHQVKTSYRKISKVARSRAADRDQRLKALYSVMIDQARQIMAKADGTLSALDQKLGADGRCLCQYWKGYVGELQYFIAGTEYVIDLAQRRILFGETIPNPDKVFSLFEPDTELINRGKSPNPIEFGHRVLVIQDNAGFIVHNQVLGQGFTDEKIITEVMRRLQDRYQGQIRAASFDKGFWTPNNFKDLSEFIPLVVLPKKGGRNQAEKMREGSKEFGKIRKWHSGIESAIHALVVGNGMKVCRDKGPIGYDRYVATAILGRNLQNLGNLLLEKERNKRKRDPLLTL